MEVRKTRSVCLDSTSCLHATEESLKKCVLSTKVYCSYVLSNTARCQFDYLNVPVIVLPSNVWKYVRLKKNRRNSVTFMLPYTLSNLIQLCGIPAHDRRIGTESLSSPPNQSILWYCRNASPSKTEIKVSVKFAENQKV